MRIRSLLALTVVAAIGGVGFAVWRGLDLVPTSEGCTAQGASRSVSLDSEQGRNAALIAAISVKRGLPARAATIAIATAIQESKLRNIDYGHSDSLGLFQQRPSIGGKDDPYWGTEAQVTDPVYAINRFFEELTKFDFESMTVTEAAQKVQRSAYPDAYADHEADARILASNLIGADGAAFTCVVHDPDDHDARGRTAAVSSSLASAFGNTDVERASGGAIVRTSGQRGWAIAQYLVAWSGELHLDSVSYDGRTWHVGDDSEDGWTPDPSAKSDRVRLSLG